MIEAKDLKVGMTQTYEIAGKKVLLKPLPLGKVKKAMLRLTGNTGGVFDMMLDFAVSVLDNGENKFATKQWVEENMTMPEARQILLDTNTINGLKPGNFLMGEAESQPVDRETRDLIEKTPTP